jgi:hypothetical protein
MKRGGKTARPSIPLNPGQRPGGERAYRWDAQKGSYVAEALEVLTLEGARVKAMTAFMTLEIFPHFGRPGELSHPGGDHGTLLPK